MENSTYATGPLGGRRRKMTVNERVERILQGSLHLEKEAYGPTHPAVSEEKHARLRQMSNLYNSSIEDKFLQNRSKPKARAANAAPVPIQNATHSAITVYPKRPCHDYEDPSNVPQVLNETTENPFHAKPWYNGYSSHQKTPTCTSDAKIRRYGAYGTAKMIASETSSGTAPIFRLNESQSLNSLCFKNEPNAWSPTLRGSPTLWSEDANCVTGSHLSFRMTRCPSPDFRYPSYPTGKIKKDINLRRLDELNMKETKNLEKAFEEEKSIRRKEIEYNKLKYEEWKARLNFDSIAHLDRPFVKVDAKKAKEITLIYSPNFNHHVRDTERLGKFFEHRYELRWKNMQILVEVMRRHSCRRPILQDIEKIYGIAYELALTNDNQFEINRQQFCELLQKEYPAFEVKHANRLFSSFDPMMTDRLDIRMFMGTVRAIRVQQGMAIEILHSSFKDYDYGKSGTITYPSFRASLIIVCGSDEDEREMESKGNAFWRDNLSQPDFLPSVNIDVVRRVLETQKELLTFYSLLLINRRQECYNSSSQSGNSK